MIEDKSFASIPVFLGIDAGGSTLRCTAVDENCSLLEKYKEKRNMNFASCGRDGIYDAFTVIRKRYERVEGICLSMAGIAGKQEFSQVESIIKDLFPNLMNLEIYPDAMGTLVANFGDQGGISVIAGTGAIVTGKNRDGEFYRSGGWGYLLGDEGSGFWIVKEAAIAYLNYKDNLGGYHDCFEVFDRKFPVPPRDFASVFYQGERRNEIAALSKQLLEYYDELINGLLDTGIKTLHKRIQNIYRFIYSEKTLSIVLNGGMFSNKRYHDEFIREFEEMNEDLKIKESVDEVETHLAVRMAKK